MSQAPKSVDQPGPCGGSAEMAGPHLVTVNGHTPVVHDGAWIAPGVVVASNVEVRAGASIWFGCVLRAEVGPIVVGADSNLQDGTVVHADPDHPVTIGERVTVGHRAVVHGCTLGDDVLVGMGAIVLNGARVGARAVVGAAALVTEGTEVAADTVVVGAPARPRELALPEVPRGNVAAYRRLAGWYEQAMDA